MEMYVQPDDTPEFIRILCTMLDVFHCRYDGVLRILFYISLGERTGGLLERSAYELRLMMTETMQ